MSDDVRRVSVGDDEIEVEVSGDGPSVLLVHGFPHTRALWSKIIPELSQQRRTIAVDLRGCGGSTRPLGGFDALTVAADLDKVLDALGEDNADVVAIDAGVPPSFALALQRPERVRRAVLMESTLGTLPGAEAFFRAGAPWWFGFHSVPGLAETVLEGHEAEYLDFFYRVGTYQGRGIDSAVQQQFVGAYSGRESLRCGFEYYRAIPESTQQLVTLASRRRLTVPTTAVGSHPVGDALFGQLEPVCDDLRGHLIPNCGHIIPLDAPAALLAILGEALTPIL